MRHGRVRTFLPVLAGLVALAILAVALLGAAPADARKQKGSCANAQGEPETISSEQTAEAIRCLLNKKRASKGMGGLSVNGNLTDAAQRHTNHMVDHDCFAHVCSGEASMVSRIKSTGYLDGASSWSVGENIAWGENELGTPAAIVAAWMDSPSHRANILNKSFDDLGVGVLEGTPSNPGHSNAAAYTTNFGFRHG